MVSGAAAVKVQAGDAELDGDLVVPEACAAMVLFAHGSGSGRTSPRNRMVADMLHEHRIGSLLVDLLTPQEQRVDAATRHLRFDIPLLGRRLIGAVDWLCGREGVGEFQLGAFGASTGAAAALIAAAQRPDDIKAVVSRGGRPDLGGESLGLVKCPVLLIVGGHDLDVIELNQLAAEQMSCPVNLEIVPGATHLFEEPGTLENAGRLAVEWFEKHLLAIEGPGR